MKGDTVIVRAFGNEPLVRRLWSTTANAVYICTAENYSNLENGRPALNPVGFSWRDVFDYDEDRLLELEQGYQENPSLWDKLATWKVVGMVLAP